MPVNTHRIGKAYDTAARQITASELEAYALATGETNPIYMTSSAEQIGPPLFAVRPLLEVLFGVLFDMSNGIDMMRLVHGEQEMRFYRPVRVKDVVVPRGSFANVHVKQSGELVTVEQRLEGEDGTLYAEAVSRMLIRAKREGGKKAGGRLEIQHPEAQHVVHTMTQHVSMDQTERYAAASGDHNPIHLDEHMAKAAGLPGRILHGLCTMAFATRALIEGPGGGDPGALESIAVRFAKPVTLGQDLDFRVRPIKGLHQMFTVEALDEQKSHVLTRVEAKVREA